MYDELVKDLREISGNRAIPVHMAETAKEAADTIEKLGNWWAQADKLIKMLEMPRWIPVTEEPPLKVGDDGYNGYLVYANGYYEVADYTTDKFDNVPYFHVDGEYEPDATHWMPLPQPPKEG